MKLSEFKWPVFDSPRYDFAMQRYMFSFKNIFSENINVGSACFLTGPTKCGKSWFLRENINKFAKSSNRPHIFHYDLR